MPALLNTSPRSQDDVRMNRFAEESHVNAANNAVDW